MKREMLLGLLAAAVYCGSPLPAAAQVFKCKQPNGTVVYQDGPCEGAAVVDTRSASGVSGGKSASSGGGTGSGAASTKPTHPVLPEKMRR
ncbi:MAG TPA: DUF4124 domain-containing protein [Burkholderiales bacterium]|nr:DUF4124 domain-containing protein [Burkholderiales bacterium]